MTDRPIPRDIKKEAERIAALILRNQKFDDAVDLIGKAMAAARRGDADKESQLPSWVQPGAAFVYTFENIENRNHGRKFHIRGIVDGMAVIREWWWGKKRWNYTVESDLYFDAFAKIIKVVRR